MSRQPKLILRESAIIDATKNWIPGSFLETGSGTGYITKLFLDRGYQGACYELGEQARSELKKNLQAYDQITVLESLSELGQKQFEYLISIEVLEHIEDDLSALIEWTKYLKEGGQILLSVPAHRKKFGPCDELVGHVRRYEREEISNLLVKAGYVDIHIINYGFPISEITRPIANLLIDKSSLQANSAYERNTTSSFQRQDHIKKIISFFGENIFLPFTVVQRLFYRFDWADGIIVIARKSSRS